MGDLVGQFYLDWRVIVVRHEPSGGHEDPRLNYRVAWTILDSGGEVGERIFASRDQGWDFYQEQQKSHRVYKVTWEHIPAR